MILIFTQQVDFSIAFWWEICSTLFNIFDITAISYLCALSYSLILSLFLLRSTFKNRMIYHFNRCGFFCVYIFLIIFLFICFENWCCSPVFVLIWFCYIKSQNGLILLFKCLLTLPPVRSFPDIICNSFLKFRLVLPSNMLTYLDLNP